MNGDTANALTPQVKKLQQLCRGYAENNAPFPAILRLVPGFERVNILFNGKDRIGSLAADSAEDFDALSRAAICSYSKYVSNSKEYFNSSTVQGITATEQRICTSGDKIGASCNTSPDTDKTSSANDEMCFSDKTDKTFDGSTNTLVECPVITTAYCSGASPKNAGLACQDDKDCGDEASIEIVPSKFNLCLFGAKRICTGGEKPGAVCIKNSDCYYSGQDPKPSSLVCTDIAGMQVSNFKGKVGICLEEDGNIKIHGGWIDLNNNFTVDEGELNDVNGPNTCLTFFPN